MLGLIVRQNGLADLHLRLGNDNKEAKAIPGATEDTGQAGREIVLSQPTGDKRREEIFS